MCEEIVSQLSLMGYNNIILICTDNTVSRIKYSLKRKIDHPPAGVQQPDSVSKKEENEE